MTKKDLIDRLERYPNDTMILNGEFIEDSMKIGWDNIEIYDNGDGNLYIFNAGEIDMFQSEKDYCL